MTAAAALPAPLVSAEVNLCDFQYMELDVARLRDSGFTAHVSPEGFRAGVLLWCASWHQQPAGSLPDDDVQLAKLAGYGWFVDQFKIIKAQALYHWLRCSDGRLYHPVIAEKANAAWRSRVQHHYDKYLDRMRKENKKLESHGQPKIDPQSFDTWYAKSEFRQTNLFPAESDNSSGGNPAENALRGNGKGKGEGEGDLIKTAGDPGGERLRPDDPVKAEIWSTGLALLDRQNVKEAAARTFLGQLCRDYGHLLVLHAVRDCAEANPAEARAWLKARCQERRQNASGNKTAAVEERNRAVVSSALRKHRKE